MKVDTAAVKKQIEDFGNELEIKPWQYVYVALMFGCWLLSVRIFGAIAVLGGVVVMMIIAFSDLWRRHVNRLEKYNPIKIGKQYFYDWEIASHEVDPENGFTPLCPKELPVPEGHMIVPELNAQARIAHIRTCSKDMHNPYALNIATEEHPQFSRITGYQDLDMYWNSHCQSGTFGSLLIDGLPKVTNYHFVAYKGMESDMHPYGACYHDLAKTLSTGLIEFYRQHNVKLIIVGGLATDYCLKETVLELLAAGFKVIVNLGASRGITPESTDNAIRLMKASGAVFVNNTEEIKTLRYSK